LQISRPILARDNDHPNYTELIHYKYSTDTDWLYESYTSSSPDQEAQALSVNPHQLMSMPRTQFYPHFKLTRINFLSEHSTLWEGTLTANGEIIVMNGRQ